MNKYNNPRLLNTVVSGTGMKNPVRPHVIIGSEENGFIRGDLMDANAIQELIVTEIAAREHGDEELTEYIDEKVQLAVDDLVDGAPEVLDTLKELSEALGDDANFATTITEEITSKVDKVEGKGLSTNDYTDAEKQKLAGIAAGAEVNVQSDWNVTSTSNDAFIKNKPTKLSLFENDDLYATTGELQNVKRKYINPIYKKTPDLYDILYSDGTISAEVISNKTPIAVCVDDGTYFNDGIARFATGIIAEEKWSVDETETTATSHTDGKSNTNALTGSDFPAAAACTNYRPGTHDGEWYLPASNELRCMYEKLSMLRHTYEHSGMGGLPSTLSSWSSTQASAQSAMVVIDNLIKQVSSLKTGKQKVIAFLTISTFTESGKIVDIESALPKYDPTNGHEYVDLGLPSGTLWATCNVGAESENDVGLYFQWGDTQGYTADQVGSGEGQKEFGLGDYKFNPSGDGSTFTKYNVTDGKTVLDLEDDAAHANWSGEWRMPTQTQLDELINNTTKTWIVRYIDKRKVYGRLFTSMLNGNTLFIPAAGNAHDGSVNYKNSRGAVLSSSLLTDDVPNALWLHFTSSYVFAMKQDRHYGGSVRGVINAEDVNKIFVPVASKDDVDELKENLTFTETTDPANGHAYVEIGGIKWATMNVGATSETDYGLYFQWGDTQGYTADQVGKGEGLKAFNWADYKYNDDDSLVMTKYNATDGKTVLDLEDDAARANWGGQWRMPTSEELQALHNAVDAVYTENYNGSGVNGILCTDKTDSTKKLFIPTAGYANGGSLDGTGGEGNIWSSSLEGNSVVNAEYLVFNNEDNSLESEGRCFGFSVRGVLDGEPETTITSVKEVVTDLKSNEEVIAAALNNLNTKIEATNIRFGLVPSLLKDLYDGIEFAFERIPRFSMSSNVFDKLFNELDSTTINDVMLAYAPTFYVGDSSGGVVTCSIVRSATQVCVFRNKVDEQSGAAIQEFKLGAILINGAIAWGSWTNISSTTPKPLS